MTLTGLTDATQYHWQARVKDAAAAYSGWVSFGGNAESASDFGLDTTAPTGGTVYDGIAAGVDGSYNDGSLSSLSANWSGVSAAASGVLRYEYSIGTSAGGTDVKGWTDNGGSASAVAGGLSLRTSVIYYVNVRTTDNAGNVSGVISSNGQLVAPTLTFTVTPNSISFNDLNGNNNFTDTKTATLTTSANGYGGYAVRSYVTSQLRSPSGKTIPAFTGGTANAPDSWQPDDQGFGYTSSDSSVQGANKFQVNPCPGGSALSGAGCYAPFSTSAPGDVVVDNTAAIVGVPISNDQYTVTYKVSVPASQSADRYSTVIVYTATVIE